MPLFFLKSGNHVSYINISCSIEEVCMQFRKVCAGALCVLLTVFAFGCSESGNSTGPEGNNPPVAKAGQIRQSMSVQMLR